MGKSGLEWLDRHPLIGALRLDALTRHLAGRWEEPFRQAIRDLREDHRLLQAQEKKYGHHSPSRGSFAEDVVQKIGLQWLVGYRLMRALHASGDLLAAKIVSRMIRHLYGSDVHWDAELAPGVVIVHGMGMAISHGVKVGPGCTLSQHVTLGWSRDPLTGSVGAPRLEAGVRVGPGATLLGPITIGEGTKIMPGAVVRSSVPARSLVEPPESLVRPRSGTPPIPTDPGPNRIQRGSL